MKQKKQFLVVFAAMFVFLAACGSASVPSVASSDPQPVITSTQGMSIDPTAAPVKAAAPLPFEIMIDATDYSFTAPEIVRAGWMLVTLTNSGQEPHHVQFLRLNDGVSIEDFEAALEKGEGPALAMTQQVGGVGAIAPGGSAQAVINLPVGEYAILCFIPSPGDGVPHHAKGMIKGLTVQESSGGTAAEPETDLVIRLQDFTFDMPVTLPAGPITIQVVNDGPEPHEWNILRLEDGKTIQDVLGYLAAPDGPPPFMPVGGMNGLDVGKTGYVEFDFQPGTYVAICNIPSPKAEGHPHFTLGMAKQFTVASTQVSSFPTGKFVSVKDAALSHQFNADGTFAFLIGETPVVQGTYRTEGDLYMELSNDDTDPKCQEHPIYKWSFDGDTLTFSPVGEDACRGRREAFADSYKVMANPLTEFKIDAADFAYTAPDTVQAGWVRVILTNSGQEPHHVQFLRLNDGVTIEQFQQALPQGEGPALALVSQVGGVGAIAPGGSAQAVINLPAGEYVILCFIPSPTDHAPHFAKGMIKSLTVQPANGIAADEPSADLTVHLQDFTFDIPASLPAGRTVIQVINNGPEPHELNLLRLAEGKGLQDALKFLTAPDGPPPFVPVGGMNGLDVGLSGYIEFDLQPGNYLAICNIPSPKAEGHPHFTLGMVKQFTVTSP